MKAVAALTEAQVQSQSSQKMKRERMANIRKRAQAQYYALRGEDIGHALALAAVIDLVCEDCWHGGEPLAQDPPVQAESPSQEIESQTE